MFCEADAAAQGIFTGELRLTEGSCTSDSKVHAPKVNSLSELLQRTCLLHFPSSSYNTACLAQCFLALSPSASFKNFLDTCVSPISHLPECAFCA